MNDVIKPASQHSTIITTSLQKLDWSFQKTNDGQNNLS